MRSPNIIFSSSAAFALISGSCCFKNHTHCVCHRTICNSRQRQQHLPLPETDKNEKHIYFRTFCVGACAMCVYVSFLIPFAINFPRDLTVVFLYRHIHICGAIRTPRIHMSAIWRCCTTRPSSFALNIMYAMCSVTIILSSAPPKPGFLPSVVRHSNEKTQANCDAKNPYSHTQAYGVGHTQICMHTYHEHSNFIPPGPAI